MPSPGGKILPGKKICAKPKDRTVLPLFKEHQGGQVAKLEEARAGGVGVKVLEDRSRGEQLGGYQSNSVRDGSGADQDGRCGGDEKGIYF